MVVDIHVRFCISEEAISFQIYALAITNDTFIFLLSFDHGGYTNLSNQLNRLINMAT